MEIISSECSSLVNVESQTLGNIPALEVASVKVKHSTTIL